MILNTDRVRVLNPQWRYLVLPVALLAVVSVLLLPGRPAQASLTTATQDDGAQNQPPPPPSPRQNLSPDPWNLAVKIPQGGGSYKLNTIDVPSLEDLSQKLNMALAGRPADKKMVFVIVPETIAEGEVLKVVNVITTAGGVPNLLQSPWGLVVTIPQGGGSYKLNVVDVPSLEDLSQKLSAALAGRPADKKTVFVKAPETIADGEVVKVVNVIMAAGGLPIRSSIGIEKVR